MGVKRIAKFVFSKDYVWKNKMKLTGLNFLGGCVSPVCNYPPSHVAIELSSKCNFNCSFCFRHKIKYPEKIMPKENAKKILESLEGHKIGEIALFGLGEPLTYPIDDLVELSIIARKIARSVIIVTNGSLLTKSVADKLAKSGFTDLRVSIDSPDPEIYRQIRGYDLEKVKNNVKYFTSVSDKPVIVQAVLTQNNYESMFNMPEMVREIGAKTLSIAPLYEFPEIKENATSNGMDKKKLRSVLQEKCDKYGISLEESFDSKVNAFCHKPFSKMFITYDARVSPCTSMPLKFGLYTNLMESWNSKEMVEFRKKVLSRNYPEWCRKSCKCRIKMD